MRVLFMGTPSIAVPCLASILEGGHTVVGVFTQPDKPQGRRYVLTPPPVKVFATERGLPVYQPETLKDEAAFPLLRELKPDVCVVVAYGKLLPPYVLEYPRYGCLNLHVSLLPKYRGAAPIARAIMAGERESGVSVMYMNEGLDTGDILSVDRFPITPDDTLGTVEEKCALIGGKALVSALAALEAGKAPRTPQPLDGASYAAKITKDDGKISFASKTEEVLCRIRGLAPAPMAVTTLADGKSLKIVKAQPPKEADPYGRIENGAPKAAPGTVLSLCEKGEGAIEVATADGSVLLVSVLPEGKGVMRASDFIRGRKVAVGDILGR
jgi:methionyl-tRNA formyltransferase